MVNWRGLYTYFIQALLKIATGATIFLSSNYSMALTPHLSSALYFGFAAAMLGVTGFETSANFVEVFMTFF